MDYDNELITAATLAREAAQANAEVLAALDRSPREAAAKMAGFAKKVAAESARRQALDAGPLMIAASDLPAFSELDHQMAALARQATALARADGQGPEGVSWGALRSLFDECGMAGKAKILSDLDTVRESNPAWHNALLELGAEHGFKAVAGRRPETGEAKRPAHGLSDYEIQAAPAWQGLQSTVSLLALDSKPDDLGSALAGIYRAVAAVKAESAGRESETGVAWREQPLSARFVSSADIQLSSVAATMMDLARRSDIDPSTDSKFSASLVAACSLMSRREAKAFVEGIEAMPSLGEGWTQFARNQLGKASSKWSAGVAAPGGAAAALSLSAPTKAFELLIPATVAIGMEEAYFGGKFKDEQAWLALRSAPLISMPDFSQAVAKASRVLSGFREKWSSVEQGAKESPRLAKEAVERASLSAKDRLGSATTGAIDAANAFTDRLEQGVKAKAASALAASALALDGAVEAAGVAVAAGRDRFVGKAGDIQRAGGAKLGSAILSFKDKLPGAPEDAEAAQARRQTMVMIGAVTGALFVGAAMAPVAGVLCATLGGVAAGMGFASALKKAGKAFLASAAKLPPFLEDLGARLGAKRAEREGSEPMASGSFEPAKADPVLGAQAGPSAMSFAKSEPSLSAPAALTQERFEAKRAERVAVDARVEPALGTPSLG